MPHLPLNRFQPPVSPRGAWFQCQTTRFQPDLDETLPTPLLSQLARIPPRVLEVIEQTVQGV